MLKIIPNLIVIFLLIIKPSYSSQNIDKNIYKKNRSDLIKIENYLNNIKYLEAKFIQNSESGEIATGKFFLSRPGKMRLQYDYPTQLLIIVNGSILSYKDLELEETSYLSTNSTPASFLTRRNFSFLAKDLGITSFNKNNEEIKVGIVKKNKKEAGEFNLIFTVKNDDSITFSKMEVKNDLDELTTVTLSEKNFDKNLDNDLFKIEYDNLPK